MRGINAITFANAKGIRWMDMRESDFDKEESVVVRFHPGAGRRKEILKWLVTKTSEGDSDWLRYYDGRWRIDLDGLRNAFDFLRRYTWLKGTMEIEPEIEQDATLRFGQKNFEWHVEFIIERAQVEMKRARKIFLSHKSKNKSLVRDFNDTLQILGFETWLDEEAMPAGTALDRGLLQGMQDSCAAVFFITPDFTDESFLATEIDYAVAEKREKDRRFAIITLVLADEKGNIGKVPDLLKRYVWKEPKTHLEGLREILKALPVRVRPVAWDESVVGSH